MPCWLRVERGHLTKRQPRSEPAPSYKAQQEASNILAAIKAGIFTTTTDEALLAAEARQAEAKAELEAIEQVEPSQILPRAKDIYQQLVNSLEQIDNVAEAREALRALLGEVRIACVKVKLTQKAQTPDWPAFVH
ncbi:hypothetical protein EIP75_02005 [Aquabacterium soli]|uniref:Uncharacterized protein n=1 Tax=Aquabacterium soli TaxID=2493092 RepID=A0A3R8S621_9BURK|nr:hypothetical protein [Aquabacterium soli]RRS06381.1 hypothetical protein EIP75_02005 [Aquabacterium soli]